jgi:hypothetical protein
MKAITFNTKETTTIKLTENQAKQLGIDINQDQQRGELITSGPWGNPVTFKALAVSSKWEKDFFNRRTETTIYGVRTMGQIRPSGYALEGYVSIGGKKYTCFTCTQMFEVNGKLIDVAVIHARIK